MHYKKRAVDPVYFILNKPAGYVCSSVSDRSPVVLDLFPQEYLVSPEGAKLHTAGRLDKDTEGLLLVTNDGRFSNFLTRPQCCISKTYLVKLQEPVSKEHQQEYVRKAAEGVMMPPDKKAEAQMSGNAKISFEVPKDFKTEAMGGQAEGDGGRTDTAIITLTEGKFHEVKRIFQALGNEVIYLKRIKIHTLQLPVNLSPGNWMPITASELKTVFPQFDF